MIPYKTKVWAMPSARAGRPTARASLRCLGYSATIAIAAASLTACKADARLASSEANPIRYSTVHTILEADLPGAAEAREALADGVLTNGEYDAILAVSEGEAERKYEADKAELKASVGRNPEGEDRNELRAKHEHAVPRASEADAHD